MGAIQAGMGIAQTAISAAKAANLPDDKQYTASPEFRTAFNRAESRSNQGFSAAERSAFDQSLARQGTTAKRMFQNAGLGGIGSAASQIMNIDALNQFAAQDANIQRQNFGEYMGAARGMQSIQDAETGRFNNQLNMQRQALGGAMQSGLGNIMGGINTGINAQQMSSTLNKTQGGITSPTGGPNAPTTTGGQGGMGTYNWQQPTYSNGIPAGANTDYGQFMNPGNQPAYVPQQSFGVYDFTQGGNGAPNPNYYQFGQ